MRAASRFLVVLVAASCGLALAACSGPEPGDTPSSGTSSSGASSSGTSSPDADVQAPDEPAGADPDATPSADDLADVLGAALLQDGSYRMTTETTSTSFGSTSETLVQVVDGAPRMRVVTRADGIETTLVVVDGASYLNLGDATGGKFFLLDASTASAQTAGADPRSSLASLDDVVGEIVVVGQEDVAGVRTTHYSSHGGAGATADRIVNTRGREDLRAIRDRGR